MHGPRCNCPDCSLGRSIEGGQTETGYGLFKEALEARSTYEPVTKDTVADEVVAAFTADRLSEEEATALIIEYEL